MAGISWSFDFSHWVLQRVIWRCRKPSGRPKLAEPDGLVVDGVEPGQHVDELVGRRRALGLVEAGDGLGVGVHDTLDEGHQVEGHAEDVGVLAHGHRGGHRDVGGPRPFCTRYSRPMSLAVASSRPSGGRRNTQSLLVVPHPEGEVRRAAGEVADGERARGALDIGGDPGGERLDGDGFSDLLGVHATGAPATMGSGWSTTQRLPLQMETMQRLQWMQVPSVWVPSRIRLIRSGSRSTARPMATNWKPSAMACCTVARLLMPPRKISGMSTASRTIRALSPEVGLLERVRRHELLAERA